MDAVDVELVTYGVVRTIFGLRTLVIFALFERLDFVLVVEDGALLAGEVDCKDDDGLYVLVNGEISLDDSIAAAEEEGTKSISVGRTNIACFGFVTKYVTLSTVPSCLP